ncbi:MAG: hydrolase [Verrucomicrobia bacterium]|nr:hydrolase [Verrucomicrobiota bacterium]
MPRVAYVDVDDTLVRSVGTKRIPMVSVVRHVRALKEEGWELYCWSSGGGDYAKATAEELGIAACFAGFLPKPDIMIDDVQPQSWSFLRVIHPAEINEPDPKREPASDGGAQR